MRKRNKFSLSYNVLLTCDMGQLIPVGCVEILPGDSIRMNTSALVRCSPLVAPVMHPVVVRLHHWFVPWRIMWDGFENFITGGPDGNDATPFPICSTNAGVNTGDLLDYFGVPTGVPNLNFSALPLRSYNAIYNEWYRDQDLQTPIPLVTTNGTDTQTSRALLNCGWEKDYFTSSRPWEQKGPTVTIPIGNSAPVKTSNAPTVTGSQYAVSFTDTAGATATQAKALHLGTGAQASQLQGTTTATTASGSPMYPNNLYADLAQASGVSVNQLRQALALQRYEENRARYGSRFPEYLRALGVTSSDARLQRPEYLSGGKQVIQFSEVLSTAETTNVKVGDMKGHGITALRSNRFTRFFEEHGYVITLMSVRPKTIYMNGLARHWNRRVKTDVWQPELEHIGQQQVLNKEVYAAHASPDGVFGYQDRYDEYRRIESRVSGDFRSVLDFWHLGRSFASAPALNSTFVTCVPSSRIFAVPSYDTLLVQVRHSIKARRLLSKTGASFTF